MNYDVNCRKKFELSDNYGLETRRYAAFWMNLSKNENYLLDFRVDWSLVASKRWVGVEVGLLYVYVKWILRTANCATGRSKKYSRT